MSDEPPPEGRPSAAIASATVASATVASATVASATVVSATFVGLATLDVVHHVEQRPGPDQKVTALRQFVSAGGPAANAAVTFAALGGRARLVTATGTGPIGRLIRSELESWGVEVVDVAPSDHEPPVSAITVEPRSGTRSVTSPDASSSVLTLPPADMAGLLDGVDAVLLDGHHAALANVAAREAATADIDVVIDAGRWKPAFADLLPRATALICSSDFRLPEHEDGEPDASAQELVARGVPLVVVTQGAGPVRWWSGATTGSLAVPGLPTGTEVDTLGAGDAFHGAYLFARYGSSTRHDLGSDADLVGWLRFAADVATLRCATPGPRAWLEHLDGAINAGRQRAQAGTL